MSKTATKNELRHMSVVAALGCVVCRNNGIADSPAVVHHVREGRGMAQRAANFIVIPLCPAHHTDGGRGVAYHASPRLFEANHGTELDLLAQTIELLMYRGNRCPL